MDQNQFQFEDNQVNRLFNKHYEPFNQCEETTSSMIVIGEITAIEVLMKITYEFLNVNNLNYSNRKQFLSNNRKQSSQYLDEEEDDDYLVNSDSNNSQQLTSNDSILNVYLSFKLLKERLNKNLNVLMDHSYLKPFCDLIMNEDINGRITAIALSSLLKFLNYGLIDYTENQGSAQLLSEKIIKVKFIKTNTGKDEVVLMRILSLIKELITRGFNLINNETVFGMIKTCFSIIFELFKCSELLRINAEHTLIDIVRNLFMRLDEFQNSERLLKQELSNNKLETKNETIKDDDKNNKLESINDANKHESIKSQQHKCYDLDCIYDLFIYLSKIASERNTSKDNTSKDTALIDLIKNQVGLNVLIVVFETAVISIGQKASLMKIVKNELCWSLVNIIQPDKKLTLFSLGLRLSSIIFLNLRMQLKYQFQEILIKIIEILSSKTSSLEYKDIAIDYLYTFFLRIQFLPHELFINYDLDPYASNILEDLLNLLSKNCFLNSKLTNIQSTGDTDVPVFNSVKRKSFNLLLLILKNLQKAELVKNYVLLPNDYQKLKKLINLNNHSLDDDNQLLDNKNRSYLILPTTREQILFLKERKKLIWEASAKFNSQPSTGIQFLKDKKLIENDDDLIKFLRENTRLDIKELGDYLSNRKNQDILEKFVKSFNFVNLRIDDALRLFLESFRLPGEAPLISFFLEQFANHWFESNNKPFANADAAFTLSYSIIMLNTDQHNKNVRQSMSCEDFVRNLRGVNGGKDFDLEMLKPIYDGIRKNKIITPAEHLGIIRDKYLWKCMLAKSETAYGIYYYTIKSKEEEKQESNYSSQITFLNSSIFEILWGPSISSLTFLFDKINMNKKTGLLKIILNQGFTSCAFLCARYGHLDDLIVSLCKFTINSAGGPMNPLLYPKSQEAALCLFNITKEYANEIRESWKNIIEIVLNWFKGKFLEDLFEIEDFALNGKQIKLKRKINSKSNRKNLNENSSNIFTGFFQFFSGNDRNDFDQLDSSANSRNLDDDSSGKNQLKYIYEQPLNILKDSKFFHFESLNELIKAIIAVNVEFIDELGDDVEVFKLELLFQIIFLNRDRVAVLWPQISNYLVKLLKSCETSEYLSERTISAIFRLAIRFICRPEKLNNQIFELMQKAMRTLSARQFQRNYTALALYTFVTHSHCYLSTTEEWKLINEIILYVGINYKTEAFIPSNLDIALSSTEDLNIQSDQENSISSEFKEFENLKLSSTVQRGYTSDSEIDLNKQQQLNPEQANLYQLMTGKSISLGKDSCFKIRDVNAYERCIEILNLIAKEIIPKYVQLNLENTIADENLTGIIESCIDTLRKFVEASIKINHNSSSTTNSLITKRTNSYKENRKRYRKELNKQQQLTLLTDSDIELDLDVEDIDHPDYSRRLKERKVFQAKLATSTESCSIKLLELMHNFLHILLNINVNFIHKNNDQTDDEQQQISNIDEDKKTLTFDYLWAYIWCPLLQGIALLCCDVRKKVRLNAYTYLERELLNPELKSLSAQQWENCFNKVLFPLLAKLLEQTNLMDHSEMDETRERITSLLSKVYLQHLNSLYTLPTFTALWLTILEFMEKYMRAEMKTEVVREAIPQRLKNMLQVMINANCLNDELSIITFDRINLFLPNFKNEVLESQQPQISPTHEVAGSIPIAQNLPNNTLNLQQQQLQDQNTNINHNVHDQSNLPSPASEQPATIYHQQHQQSFNLYNQEYQQQQSPTDNKMFVNLNSPNLLNQYRTVNYNFNLHDNGQLQNFNNQTQSVDNAYNIYNPSSISYNNDLSNQKTNQEEDKKYSPQHQTANYNDQLKQQQQHYYQQSHYQIESSINQIPNYSTPNYNQDSSSSISSFGGTSPPIYQQQPHLNQPIQTSSQSMQNLDQSNYIPNYSNKVIEMPILQSSLNLNEGMYQQLQQQKTFTTSSAYTNSSSYPWPSPKQI